MLQGVENQRLRQSCPWQGCRVEGLDRWAQLSEAVTLNSVPSLATQMMSLRCVPEPHSEEHSDQGPAYQCQVLSQGPRLQARMSGGRLPGTQLSSPAPAPWASPLPRQTTERRWMPVPHSAEHLELQSL